MFRKEKITYTKKHIISLVGIIFTGGFLAPIILLFGLKTAQASSVAIWLNMELVATAVLGTLFFKEHLGRNGWIGVILTLAAGVILAFSEGMSGAASALLVTTACIFWGLDNHLTSIIDSMSPSEVTFIKGIFAGVVNLIIGCIISGYSISVYYIIIALLVGAFSYGISILLYIISSQNIGATRGQILFSTAPVFSIIISLIFLGESFTYFQLISIILIFIGVYFSTVLYHEHKHKHMANEHVHLHSHDDSHHLHYHKDLGQNIKHTHLHSHKKMDHAHIHYPDIHHRHDH